jgi:hypothetical protein
MVQKKTSKSGGTLQNEHQHGTRYGTKSNQNGTEKNIKEWRNATK